MAAEPSLSSKNQTDLDAPDKLSEKHSKADVESTTGTDDGDVLQNERDLVTHVISVEDDPSLNPWTFRSFFIGIGLSTFGGVLGKCPPVARNHTTSLTASISGNLLLQTCE